MTHQDNEKETSCRKSWYRNNHPNEHTYTLGYGFSSKPPALVERRLISTWGNGMGLCVLTYLFIISFFPTLLFYLFDKSFSSGSFSDMEEILSQTFYTVASVGALLIPFSLFAAYVMIPRSHIVQNRPISMRIALGAVGVAMAASAIGMTMGEALEGAFSFFGLQFRGSEFRIPTNPAAAALCFINLTFIPAVFEEYAFRGVVLQSLRRFGDGFALLTSSMLFALVHIQPSRMPNAFLVGLVMGYFVLRTGSIRISMLIHFINNVVIFTVSVLVQGIDSRAFFIGLRMIYLLIGILAFFLILKRHNGLPAMASSNTINNERCKCRAFWCTVPMVVTVAVIVIISMGWMGS